MRSLADRPIKKLPALRGRTVVNLFFEDSTRTRISFEAAAKRLSADVINFAGQGLQRCPRARASRTPRSRSRRWAPTRSSSATAPAARRTGWPTPAGSAPAWSTPATAPTSTPPRRCSTPSRCGATSASDGGGLDGRRVAIVGDVLHSRVARSNALLLRTLGAEVTLVAPPTLFPVGVEGWPVETSYDLDAVLPKADVVMMLRVQRGADERVVLPDRARVLAAATASTASGCATLQDHTIVMHPGPMVRGMEITADVADSDRSVIVEQVTNGVAVRMAVLYLLLGGRSEPAVGRRESDA